MIATGVIVLSKSFFGKLPMTTTLSFSSSFFGKVILSGITWRLGEAAEYSPILEPPSLLELHTLAEEWVSNVMAEADIVEMAPDFTAPPPGERTVFLRTLFFELLTDKVELSGMVGGMMVVPLGIDFPLAVSPASEGSRCLLLLRLLLV